MPFTWMISDLLARGFFTSLSTRDHRRQEALIGAELVRSTVSQHNLVYEEISNDCCFSPLRKVVDRDDDVTIAVGYREGSEKAEGSMSQ